MTINKVKEHLNNINLGDYDLGGVEIDEEDYESIIRMMNNGKSLEEATHECLLGIRNVLDEDLD